jgi:hypothetical protein
LRLVKSQELEKCAFVLLQFFFQVASRILEGLDAGIILPDEALELSGTIC